MCTKYYDHCTCGSMTLVADGQTSIILVIFWPFYPLSPERWENGTFQKKFEKF